jgi:hypothetical protein
VRMIVIQTVPHSVQRYPTCGDYREATFAAEAEILPRIEPAELITVSAVGNPDFEFLVGLHELIEWYLTQKRGIQEAAITAFDVAFKGRDEPGDDPSAPYHREHRFATDIEMQVAAELGVDWNEYEAAIEALG